jgi:hypothetical protein
MRNYRDAGTSPAMTKWGCDEFCPLLQIWWHEVTNRSPRIVQSVRGLPRQWLRGARETRERKV